MKQGLFLLFSFCVISNAYAADDCLQRPTCEELGYTQTAEECVGKSILPCPFNLADSNLVFCGSTEDDCPVMSGCLEYDSACACTACGDGFTLSEGICVDPCVEKCKTAYPLFAGQANTKAAIDQIGNEALAAYAASQFYVGDKDGDFGQGKWYLPSIGEWMYFYGTDVTQMTNGYGTSGVKGDNKTLINNALTSLANAGVAEKLSQDSLWSSSEGETTTSWTINGVGNRHAASKYSIISFRCSLLLKNIFNPSEGGTAPKVGDVVYLDKTYGAAADYDWRKTAVGVVSSVSTDKHDVTILNLKDLAFSSYGKVENFNPDNPYSGSASGTYWNTDRRDITKIQDFDGLQFLTAAKASDNCPCQFYPSEASDDTCTGASECKDSSGNCITCYASCSAYNSSYKDSQPSGQTCSTKDVMIGAGNGATATSKTCYYNCSTIDTCTGANKCKDSSGNCVDCYSSCSAYNSSYKDSEPSGYTCSSTSVWIGSGNGATASRKTCYYDCSEVDTCTGKRQCYYNGSCVPCCKSCSDCGAGFVDEIPEYQICGEGDKYIGAGYGATATKKVCYSNCQDLCTGAHVCKDPSGGCVPCYATCSDYDSTLMDSEPEGQKCQSGGIFDASYGKAYMFGAGNGAMATTKMICYSKCTDACNQANRCRTVYGTCVDCYSSCSAYNSSYKDSQPTGQTCSTTTIYQGAGYGGDATGKPCYYDCKDNCTGANKCIDSSGNCVTCYASCSAYSSSYTDSQLSGYSCSSTSMMIGSGNGATATSKPCYKCTCTGSNKCKTSSGDCVDCYSSCKAAGYSDTDCSSSADMCSLYRIYIGSGNGSTVTGEKDCYLKE